MSDIVSGAPGTRIYIGQLPAEATEEDIRQHFANSPDTVITEVKLKGKYGFVEYRDEVDAQDVVPRLSGKPFMSSPQLIVQFAKGHTVKPNYIETGNMMRPQQRRTDFGLVVQGLPIGTSWQDLKDHARRAPGRVAFTQAPYHGPGTGVIFYESSRDLTDALKELDRSYFLNTDAIIECTIEVPRRDRSRSPRRGGPGELRRASRSPPRREDRGYDNQGGYEDRRFNGGYNDRRQPRFDDRNGQRPGNEGYNRNFNNRNGGNYGQRDNMRRDNSYNNGGNRNYNNNNNNGGNYNQNYAGGDGNGNNRDSGNRNPSAGMGNGESRSPLRHASPSRERA